jgi:predicted esterase
MRKLKILCFHGYNGSAQVLRRQLAPLATSADALCDFVCVDTPALAVGDHGWWHAISADGPASAGRSSTRRYEGFQRSRAAVVAAFQRLGPFDGIFGFSQGAALAGLLVGLRSPSDWHDGERPLRFDFAIMVGGFPSRDPELARLYERRDSYRLPSLHVFGRSDDIVSEQQSRALAAEFVRPVLAEHPGGHVIDNGSHVRGIFREFLEQRLLDLSDGNTSERKECV